MIGIDAALVISVSLLLLFPGVLLLFSLFPNRSLGEIFFIGGAVGWALVVMILRLFPLGWSPFVLGVVYLGTMIAAFFEITKAKEDKLQRFTGSIFLWLLAILSFALKIIPSMACELPPGQDPKFHLIVIKKILIFGTLPENLSPIAGIKINYPLGSHLWTALVSKLSGMEAHFAFRVSFPVIGFFIAGVIYLLAMELLDGDRRSSFFASLIWVVGAAMGGWRYFMDGDLPHAIGTLLLISAIWLMFAEQNLRGRIITGVLFAAMMFCHYHTALVFVILAFAFSMIEKLLGGRFGPRSVSACIAAIVAIIIFPMGFINAIILSIRPGETDIYKYAEMFLPVQFLMEKQGFLVFFAGAFGVYFLARNSDREKKLVLLTWITILLVILALFGYLFRVLAFGYWGGFFAVGAPSNVITDLVVPLCIAGGWFICNTEESYRRRAIAAVAISTAVLLDTLIFKWLDNVSFKLSVKSFFNTAWPIFVFAGSLIGYWFSLREKKEKAAIFFAAAFSLLLIYAAVFDVILQANKAKNAVSVFDVADLHVMKDKIPADSIIIDLPQNQNDWNAYGWIPYLTWHESSHVVLPYTEERNSYDIYYKRRLLPMDIYEIQLQSHIEGKAVTILTPRGADYGEFQFKTVYESNNRRFQVYEPGTKQEQENGEGTP